MYKFYVMYKFYAILCVICGLCVSDLSFFFLSLVNHLHAEHLNNLDSELLVYIFNLVINTIVCCYIATMPGPGCIGCVHIQIQQKYYCWHIC